MSLSRLALVLGALAMASCNNNNNNGIAFPFERAEHLAFVCFAPKPAPFDDEYVVLPQDCCRITDPSATGYQPANAASPLPVECTRAGADLVGGTALLHALVTQSTRGEVAAVDLVNNRVLDSDRLVPGFTFLDTGGLPSAIVAPALQPRVLQPAAPAAPVLAGPAWTYIASAEENQVRAIATCRYRSGGACGPDLTPENLGDPAYDQRTRVALPASPRDMLLGPGPGGPDQALWVTLPDLGRIARIDLAETPLVRADPNVADSPLVARSVDPFALEANRATQTPPLFVVPSAAAQQAALPVREDGEYTALCGLGVGRPFTPSDRTLPLAPRSAATAEVQPDRMHFDALSGLLLVTDRVAPVLHAFRYTSDGALETLGALPTGTQVRDFVITPAVPANQPRDLLTNPALAEDPVANTKRYLYAIDNRGMLMLFDFVARAGTADGAPAVSLVPLEAPTPGTGYLDRIELPTPLSALEVIDTRTSSDYVCGQRARATMAAELSAAKAEPKPHSSLTTATIAQLEARIDIEDEADVDQLRGVFIAAASANGVLSIIDVHDLDAACRARKDCCTDTSCSSGVADLAQARDTSDPDAVAIRRHTVRRRSASQVDVTVPNSALLAQLTCGGDERFVAIGVADPATAQVCAPSDPWTERSETWTATYQSPIPNSQTKGAALRLVPENPAQLEVLAPLDMNLCQLGVQVGDLVAVLGDPPKRLLERCGRPTADTASLFVVDEAFADRLLTHSYEPPVITSSIPGAGATVRNRARSVTEITTCYPDQAGVELRAGQFLVLGAGGTYLHRVTTNLDDGRCIVDERKDARLTSRPVGATLNDDLVFKNPFVEFTLKGGESFADQTLRNTSVTLRNGTSALQVTSVSTGDTTTDALPAALHYEPQTSALFLLDTASQGLRRYLLRPFEYDTRSFR